MNQKNCIFKLGKGEKDASIIQIIKRLALVENRYILRGQENKMKNNFKIRNEFII